MNDEEHFEYMRATNRPFAMQGYKATPSELSEMERLLRVGAARHLRIDAERLIVKVTSATWLRPTGVGEGEAWVQGSLNRWQASTAEARLDGRDLDTSRGLLTLDRRAFLEVRNAMLTTRLLVRPDVRQTFVTLRSDGFR